MVSTLYAFITRNGYRPKYRKHDIFDGNERMMVNSLVVNKRPALPESERFKIRGIVHRTVRQLQREGTGSVAGSLPTVLGKIGKLKRFMRFLSGGAAMRL